MAYVPDEAIDRMAELSAGAWRLYCFLARCRNQKTGKCCPSVQTTAEAIDTHPKNIFKLRKELATAGWGRFDGNDAFDLFGFGSSKNTTADVPAIEVMEESSKNTTIRAVGSKNATIQTPVVAKTLPLVAKTLPNGSKNTTAIHEEPAKEPANRTSKEEQDMSDKPDGIVFVRQVFTYWQERMQHPQAKLTPKREKSIKARLGQKYTVADIKRAIDGCASSPFHMGQNETGTVYDDIELICRNGEKLESFISRSNGGNGNGRHQVPSHKETHNERAARETEELIRRSLEAASGIDSTDTGDANAPWVAADYRRL